MPLRKSLKTSTTAISDYRFQATNAPGICLLAHVVVVLESVGETDGW